MRPESSPWMIRQEALFRSMSYPISSDLSSLKTPDCPVCSRGVRQIQMFPCVGKYTHFVVAERGVEAKSPPWERRGGRAIKKNSRSNERRGRGGSFKLQNNFFWNNPTFGNDEMRILHSLTS